MNFPEIYSETGMMELILKERLFAMQDKQYAAYPAWRTDTGSEGVSKVQNYPLYKSNSQLE